MWMFSNSAAPTSDLLSGFGFGTSGLVFRVQVLGVWGVGFRVYGLGFGVWGLGLRVEGWGLRVEG